MNRSRKQSNPTKSLSPRNDDNDFLVSILFNFNEPIATRNIDYYNNLFHDRLNSLNEIQTNYENDDDFYDEWNNDQNDSFFEPSISMNSPFYYNTIAIQSNYNSEQNNCPAIKPTEQTKDLHHPMKFNSFESSTPSTILSKPKYKQKRCISCRKRQTPRWHFIHTKNENLLFCNACAMRFKKYKSVCSNCYHAYKKDELNDPSCPRCHQQSPFLLCNKEAVQIE